MGNFDSVLSITRTALRAQQAALQVASQNIANAQTEGYTRTRARLVPMPEVVMPQGMLGTGVAVADVTRVRDGLLDTTYRREAMGAGAADARHTQLARLETVMAEPSETGLGAALDAFTGAWTDLASDPTSVPARQVVVQRGQQVAQWLNDADGRIVGIQRDTLDRITTGVRRLNTLLQQVATLNAQIVPAEAGGQSANALRDERDRVVDELASLAGVETHEQGDGSLTVIVGGQTVVDASRATLFNAPILSAGAVQLTLGLTTEPVQLRGGQLAGWQQVHNTDLPGVRAQLDAIATGVVTTVNRWHRTGWTAAGQALAKPGATYGPATPAALRGSRVDFFQSPAGTAPGVTPTVLAREIRLSDDVLADVNVVAAGRAGWNGTGPVAQPGENSIALALASLRSSSQMPDDTSLGLTDPPATIAAAMLGGRSAAEAWRAAATDVGLAVAEAKTQQSSGEALTQQADERRRSVSGVSIDEELVNVTRAQQAYQAAARVLTTVTEMTRDLLAIGR